MFSMLWCWRRLLRILLDSKEIKPVNPKGNQRFIGRTDAEAEAPILWPPDAKSWLRKDAGKDWGQEKRATEDEMVEWHHWLSGHELSKLQEMVKDSKAWRHAVHGITKSSTQLSNNNHQGREGMEKQWRSSQETIMQPWGRVLIPPQRIHIRVSFSSLQNSNLQQMESVNTLHSRLKEQEKLIKI